jgi:maltooligosyltrehalose trehalohydrolase
MEIGADYDRDGKCRFVVWAPAKRKMELKLTGGRELLLPMVEDGRGYWTLTVEGVLPGARYLFRVDETLERPDPASHWQPEGVHGPSAVVDHHSFQWNDHDWTGIDLSRMILYEIHTGTFTPQGTFDAILPRLKDLRKLGINALELMPVGQFPGERNWGYDGVYPFAAQDSYGGPEGLKRLVDGCHREGVAVILDVVYNHLGPEGNYLRDYGPYFSDKYRTPWGEALNFDDAYSDQVRDFFIQNALFWFSRYHIDGLRLDALHAIVDMSATPFLQELARRTKEYSLSAGRPHVLIGESDLNDARLIAPQEAGGCGLDAQWCDDFHHGLHALITGERRLYYVDFGSVLHLQKSIGEGYAYSGDYSVYRKRRHGNSSRVRPAEQFIVFSQNHDQTGNRLLGERLSQLVDLESLKLSAAMVLLSPYVPLLFMGEEYGEESPFLYFVSHSDKGLIEAVREGRRREFDFYQWKGEMPDPESIETFHRSKLQWEMRQKGWHAALLEYYGELIRLRTKTLPFCSPSKDRQRVEGWEGRRVIAMMNWSDDGCDHGLCFFNLSDGDVTLYSRELADSDGVWEKRLNSSDEIWHGPGSSAPHRLQGDWRVSLRRRSALVYLRVRT